jgi:hypothetical protein
VLGRQIASFAFYRILSSVLLAIGYWAHSASESSVFGLFTATVEFPYPFIFNIRHSTYRVFKTVLVEDLGLVEIVAAVLLSAYHWDGGFNYALTDDSQGNSKNRQSDAYLDGLWRNAESIKNSSFINVSIADAGQKIRRVNLLTEIS